MAKRVYVLGGDQTDFARNLTREKKTLADLMREAVQGALAKARVDPRDVEVGHVGNFAAELFCDQGHLGGLFVEADRAFVGLPTSRHEAACASGSAAVLAAMADIEAERYGLACVLGVELMRGGRAVDAQAKLGCAAWVPRETEGVAYPWPELFSRVADAYDARYGLRREHLAAIARINFENARRNPNAQTRGWAFGPRAFDEDEAENPVIAGRIRKQDCSQITDGAAAVFLASEAYAAEHAKRRGISLASLARIDGWGHRTSRMALEDKLAQGHGKGGAADDDDNKSGHLFPHVRQAITDAMRRAAIAGPEEIDTIECHDCFTITEYMAIDHFGLTPPGQSWRAVEEGAVAFRGRTPINPSGGLMGLGHPVGASGVRMLLDGQKQVTGQAGDYQVEGARRAATLNIGGSTTTTAVFLVARGEGA